jgi:hypothetical protein
MRGERLEMEEKETKKDEEEGMSDESSVVSISNAIGKDKYSHWKKKDIPILRPVGHHTQHRERRRRDVL